MPPLLQSVLGIVKDAQASWDISSYGKLQFRLPYKWPYKTAANELGLHRIM